ncbi:MAG: hypothetical protein AAF067_11625 [Pseudomonadota bacterium]
MAKIPPSEHENPEEFPQTTPRDLHPTSDIRFVMIEVAKLNTLVERLISDVDDQSEKIDGLRHQATYIKGGLAVAIVALGFFGWFISQLVEGKMQSVLTALSALQK